VTRLSRASRPLPFPPFGLRDSTGRAVLVRPVDESAARALEAFYEAFDPGDRAQGLPPIDADRIARWLEVLAEGPGVLAEHDGRVVGHAALVPDRLGAHELVVFVARGFRGTGIGTALVRGLLGLGQACGLRRAWLTVQRWNQPAIAVYRKTGFEREGEEGLEIIMARDLHPQSATGRV